ncbi:MAG: hypothetical protein JWN48_1105 [Myxococcaceae bacterium]|nr:hypothetical protein [Myxococcaceae bacterium]
MKSMRSYALALGSVGLCCLPWVAGCSSNADRDYQVAVPWTINGMVPDPGLCQEQRIARGRFEVTTGSGKPLKTLEGDCAGTVTLSDGFDYGGFLTTRSFDWDRTYNYSLSLVDAAGNPVSTPGRGSFRVGFDEADIYELSFLDFLNPAGTVAGFSGEWSVRTNPDLVASCAAERISKVRILVASALDTELVDATPIGEANCAEGKFVSNGKVLATGDYLFQYVAVSEGGNVVEAGNSIPAKVDGSKDIALPREMFLSNPPK